MEDLVSWLESEPEKGEFKSFVLSKEGEVSDERFCRVRIELVSLGGGYFAATTNEELNGVEKRVINEKWEILNSDAIADKVWSVTALFT